MRSGSLDKKFHFSILDSRFSILYLVLVGFALRAAFFFHWNGPPASLQDDYFERAVMMIRHQPLTLAQDLFRPPLYAWALYLLFLVTGINATAASLLQCALGAGTAWMLYRMAKALGDEKAGVAAAAIWTVNIYSVYYSARLMNETLYVALTVAFFWAWIEAGKKNRSVAASTALSASAGLLAGLSCLCKWTFMGYLPWFAAAAAWPLTMATVKGKLPMNGHGAGLARWKPLVLCLAAAALVVIVFGLRNHARYGRFFLAGPQKGWNFYEGLALQTAEDPERPQQMSAEAARLGIDKDPFVQDDYFWKKGWAEVKEDPKAAVLLFAGKAVKFWRLAPYPPHPRAVRWAAGVFYLLLFSMALQGGILAHRRGLPLAPMFALILFTWLVHTVMFSGIRYRFPLDPFLSLFAGFSLAELLWGSGKESA